MCAIQSLFLPAGTKVILAGEDGEITEVGGGGAEGETKTGIDEDATTEVPTDRASTDAGKLRVRV